jgi:7-cyano-7-deazaguanine synthase in queuosine biosynthesis/MoaA/NifB/PqqE/SkfB family radical SAM enzyme
MSGAAERENVKTVVLNSGGFDSTVLMHWCKKEGAGAEIASIYFSYGQRNDRICGELAGRTAEKLGAEHYEIALPPFPWTRSAFFKDGYEAKTQYLEMRNLVFLSCALSLAQSIGAGRICAAFVKSRYGYSDTSPQFIEDFGALASNACGVELRAPFSDADKADLAFFALKSGIAPKDYFSCDVPTGGGKPCGECPDCEALAPVEKMLVEPSAHLAFCAFGPGPEFEKAFMGEPVREMRVLLNNSCQLECPHCFYGFGEMKGAPLTFGQWKSVYAQAYQMGVRAFHFSGKEPLFDGDVFAHAGFLKASFFGAECTVATNGINAVKYKDEILRWMDRLFLNSDFHSMERKHGLSEKVIPEFARQIPITVFIDLDAESAGHMPEILDFYMELGVADFHARTIRATGSGKSIPTLSEEQIMGAIDAAKAAGAGARIHFDIGAAHTAPARRRLAALCAGLRNSGTVFCSKGVSVAFEEYCSRYAGQITVTPDGYVLGCGMEMGCAGYDRIAAGNVLRTGLGEAVRKGKMGCMEFNRRLAGGEDFFSCPHETC